ncbi:MAG: DNA ligase D [Chitinophagales bacterium]|nr:DNA ligase D [Chitinophagales bacterium]
MSLTEYKKKRSFSKTPEPSGAKEPASNNELIFVIQKHQASHLHYDFRLEIKGVLKSWAVPKGPSINPADKRLAMLVEDHPFDYKDFEGIIPKGNYGAGTVIVWDHGTYEPAEKSSTKAEKEKILMKGFFGGSLAINMKGKKLKGEFVLVKAPQRGERSWLLIKKKDKFSAETDITKKEESVISHKTLNEVAADKKAKQWISNRASAGTLKENESGVNQPNVPLEKNTDLEEIVRSILFSLEKKKKSSMPVDIKPMLATLVDQPFDDPDWIFEVKWDGYRALAYLNNGKAELRSRNNHSFNDKFYPVYNAMKTWSIKAVIDGEIAVINEKGLAEFQLLQNWTTDKNGELIYYAFDILWLNGIDLMSLPLTERRNILSQIMPEHHSIRLSENFETSGTEFFAAAEKLGIEGIIAKKADSEYVPNNRTKNWLKIKSGKRHEAIIAGYTRNEDTTKQFSALILAVHENGELKFIGQAGTGYTEKMRTEILKKLKPLETEICPFRTVPEVNRPSKFRPNPPEAEITWVKPEVVCEVRYQELTLEGVMRHPSFQGLRIDKKAREVVDEQPVHTTNLVNASKPSKQKRIVEPGNRKKYNLLNDTDESQLLTINGHELKFSNLGKMFWPKEKVTKRDMLNYYYKVLPYMLPYMKDRPQSLNRHPNGIEGPSFYQKNVAGKVDDWIVTHQYKNTSQDGTKTFLVCSDEASLLYIANLGCIEMNPWHSRTISPDNPDWCVIDLDPDINTFEEVIEAANVVKKVLDALGVPSFPKTSGSTGIHIYIPLGALYTYEQSKQLAELIVTFVHEEITGFTSLERTPSKRKGKIYLDFLQNRAIQTIAAPYSLRPKPGATVSTPLNWEEIKPGLKIQDFTIFNTMDRIKNTGDLFKGVFGEGIDIAKVLEKMKSL